MAENTSSADYNQYASWIRKELAGIQQSNLDAIGRDLDQMRADVGQGFDLDKLLEHRSKIDFLYSQLREHVQKTKKGDYDEIVGKIKNLAIPLLCQYMQVDQRELQRELLGSARLSIRRAHFVGYHRLELMADCGLLGEYIQAAHPDVSLSGLEELGKRGRGFTRLFLKEVEKGRHQAVQNALNHPNNLSVILNRPGFLGSEQAGDYIKRAIEFAPTVLGQALLTQGDGFKLPAPLALSRHEQGNTIFHLAATKPALLGELIKRFEPSVVAEAMMRKNSDGNRALSLALGNPDALRILLEAMPEEKRFHAVMRADSPYNSERGGRMPRVLDKAVETNVYSFIEILQMLPANKRYDALMNKREGGGCVWDTVTESGNLAKNLKLLIIILRLLPRDRLGDVLTKKTSDGLSLKQALERQNNAPLKSEIMSQLGLTLAKFNGLGSLTGQFRDMSSRFRALFKERGDEARVEPGELEGGRDGLPRVEEGEIEGAELDEEDIIEEDIIEEDIIEEEARSRRP